MTWLSENWFWVLIAAVFLGFHFIGHKGHGRGHEKHTKHGGGCCGGGRDQDKPMDQTTTDTTKTTREISSEHQQ